mmetsp:Transcript_46220/g.33977  ORF Transcript_46220/g.33977 Transcript_46220/m.33977 type:complete len:80 (+) Transcript_46220:81-320(+)
MGGHGKTVPDGEKILSKKQQMMMGSGEAQRQSRQNQTRSLIEDGSEDFTNIDEHLDEDTRVSCKNAVASSLNNVSQMFR